MKVVVRKKTVAPWDPRIPPKLTPSFHGRECLGNGEWPGYECCCDECDYYLACFPDCEKSLDALMVETQDFLEEIEVELIRDRAEKLGISFQECLLLKLLKKQKEGKSQA